MNSVLVVLRLSISKLNFALPLLSFFHFLQLRFQLFHDQVMVAIRMSAPGLVLVNDVCTCVHAFVCACLRAYVRACEHAG